MIYGVQTPFSSRIIRSLHKFRYKLKCRLLLRFSNNNNNNENYFIIIIIYYIIKKIIVNMTVCLKCRRRLVFILYNNNNNSMMWSDAGHPVDPNDDGDCISLTLRT